MSVDEPPDASPASAGEGADEDGPQGVFGNLPQTRPGARSPRRDRGSKRGAKAPAPSARSKPAAESGPAERPAPGDAADPEGGGGIEEVAWAGVAAAAEAATIGVRLATRALEAMRDAVDRR